MKAASGSSNIAAMGVLTDVKKASTLAGSAAIGGRRTRARTILTQLLTNIRFAIFWTRLCTANPATT